jgi:hypothetical protein
MADVLFRSDGLSTFVPTSAAVGPWDKGVVHGAAVGALFAGRLAPPGFTPARLTVEFLTAVPMAPLTLDCREPTGGRRVQRQDAVLSCDGREVAAARSVLVHQGELDLPQKARDHPSPFDPAAAPPLDEPNRDAAKAVGWDSFDSTSLIWEWMRVDGDPRTHAWIRLAVPVVEGTVVRGVELAVVAADYAQAAVNRRLSMADWSFRNAEQTLHLSREPVGPWIGMRCESVVQPVGAGFNAADLFDTDGRVGRSAAAIVVERR